MSWNEGDEARKVYKFLKNGVLMPEDLKHNEIRLLREYYPRVYMYIKEYYEYRNERIEAGDWTEDDEPPDNDWRINRYENGEAIIDPWK